MKNKVFNLIETSRFRFAMERHVYEKETRGGSLRKECGLIILKDMKTGRNIVHPFTEFIKGEFGNNKIKTQIDNGGKITAFLNYILDNLQRLRLQNFCQLKYEHASLFLNYHCGSLNRDTVIRYRNVLAKFYYFLAKRKLLDNCKIEDFIVNTVIRKNGVISKVIIAPFEDVDLPEAKAATRNEHDMPPELQAMLLEVAIEEVNEIAFGLALSMFGGFRLGELVNLTYSAIRTIGYYGEHGLLITIKDNALRSELKNNSAKGFAKRPRFQQALSPFGLMGFLFKKHKMKYSKNGKNDAVFINANGQAMTYESYKYYFGKLKKKFFERLNKSENPLLKSQSLVLQSRRWFTHIGRGVFSNNIIDIVDNASQAQALRGDKSIDSVSVYVCDSRRLGKKFEENTEDVFAKLLEKYNPS
ncbi:hypothetical protein [Clostridium beijerinckii]|uniref:hypothetical protein n=1 Tax=Clostridium beijerinckii TaxID=1520 RepID=UPI0022E5D9AD|nr:hypothetical protein [Clostridium beijerinckii]